MKLQTDQAPQKHRYQTCPQSCFQMLLRGPGSDCQPLSCAHHLIWVEALPNLQIYFPSSTYKPPSSSSHFHLNLAETMEHSVGLIPETHLHTSHQALLGETPLNYLTNRIHHSSFPLAGPLLLHSVSQNFSLLLLNPTLLIIFHVHHLYNKCTKNRKILWLLLVSLLFKLATSLPFCLPLPWQTHTTNYQQDTSPSCEVFSYLLWQVKPWSQNVFASDEEIEITFNPVLLCTCIPSLWNCAKGS